MAQRGKTIYLNFRSFNIMELHISLEYGALNAEISASEQDDYEEVLQTLADFLNEHPQLANNLSDSPEEGSEDKSRNREKTDNAPLSQYTSKADGEKSSSDTIENEMLRSLLGDVNVSEDDFIRTFEAHEDVAPRILKPDLVPGETKGERILNASLVITTICQECYNKNWMKTSELSNSLEQSGLSSRTDYIYNQDNWQSLLNKDGEKRGTKLRVTRLGKDKAEELIKSMAQ